MRRIKETERNDFARMVRMTAVHVILILTNSPNVKRIEMENLENCEILDILDLIRNLLELFSNGNHKLCQPSCSSTIVQIYMKFDGVARW